MGGGLFYGLGGESGFFAFSFLGGLGELFAELEGFEDEEFPLTCDGAFGWFDEFFEDEFGFGMRSEESESGLAASAGAFGVED